MNLYLLKIELSDENWKNTKEVNKLFEALDDDQARKKAKAMLEYKERAYGTLFLIGKQISL